MVDAPLEYDASNGLGRPVCRGSTDRAVAGSNEDTMSGDKSNVFPTTANIGCFVGLMLLIAPLTVSAREVDQPRQHDLTAKTTLTVVQMNHGDTLRFRLRNGEIRTFVLEKTSARIIERNRGGVVFSFDCHLLADAIVFVPLEQ